MNPPDQMIVYRDCGCCQRNALAFRVQANAFHTEDYAKMRTAFRAGATGPSFRRKGTGVAFLDALMSAASPS
jgi:hypothetical protein